MLDLLLNIEKICQRSLVATSGGFIMRYNVDVGPPLCASVKYLDKLVELLRTFGSDIHGAQRTILITLVIP